MGTDWALEPRPEGPLASRSRPFDADPRPASGGAALERSTRRRLTQRRQVNSECLRAVNPDSVRSISASLWRLLGAALVAVGCAILVVDVPRLDVVLLEVTHSHGLHFSDFLGTMVVIAGISVLWVAPRR
jgi:hypothetical protein